MLTQGLTGSAARVHHQGPFEVTESQGRSLLWVHQSWQWWPGAMVFRRAPATPGGSPGPHFGSNPTTKAVSPTLPGSDFNPRGQHLAPQHPAPCRAASSWVNPTWPGVESHILSTADHTRSTQKALFQLSPQLASGPDVSLTSWLQASPTPGGPGNLPKASPRVCLELGVSPVFIRAKRPLLMEEVGPNTDWSRQQKGRPLVTRRACSGHLLHTQPLGRLT